VSAEAACMDDALRDALMIKVEELFSKMKILEGDRTANSDLEGILVIGYRYALLCCQNRNVSAGSLMNLSASRGSAIGTFSCDFRAFGLPILLHWFVLHGQFAGCCD
jgi:hypothetical protein